MRREKGSQSSILLFGPNSILIYLPEIIFIFIDCNVAIIRMSININFCVLLHMLDSEFVFTRKSVFVRKRQIKFERKKINCCVNFTYALLSLM